MFKVYTKSRILTIALITALTMFFSATALAKKPSERVTIVDTALAVNAQTGEFSILIAALLGTGLDMPLAGNGQFTVFAPVDAAFESIGFTKEAIEAATQTDDGKAFVSNVLLYHVARGQRLSPDVLGSDQIRTLNGGFVYPDAGSLTIGDNQGGESGFVSLDLIDIVTDNGVIHVIDRVLLP
jgi:uncharacterized surface protein with fasciclin (FAS1) repeats